jgi:Zn-dependent peptidase ImmA (M78 family)
MYRSRLSDIQELEANKFAATLLMPKSTILDFAKLHNVKFESLEKSEDSVKFLAKEFQVSPAAMSLRLQSIKDALKSQNFLV